MSKFSLIVCNYNNGKYFKTCFDSILKQTYSDLEIIIIDDKSTDDSVEIIQEIIDGYPQVKFFSNDKNYGYAHTLHRGITLASGEFVGRVDPDDALTENAIEASLKHYSSSDIIATYSQIKMCDGNLDFQHIYPRTRKIKNNNYYFFNINNEVSHFFTFRKDTYLQTEGISEKLSSSVDFDLYLKLYEKGDFYFIEEPLYLYRQHQGGISQDKTKKERVYKNWNQVLLDTCKRRGIENLYSEKVTPNSDLVKLIFKEENKPINKLKRLFSMQAGKFAAIRTK